MDISWLVGILVILAIACVCIWAARKLMAAYEIGEPLSSTVVVILVVVFAVALLLRLVPGAVHL